MEEKLGFNTYLKFSSYKSTLAPTDLETFPSVRNVKSIVVHFYIWEDWQRDLCDKIILSSSPTLEELKYEWFFDQEFVPCTGTVFPKLKKLVIDCRLFDSQCPRNPPLKMVGKAITESFPALEVLKIDCNNLYEISNVEMLQKFPLQVSDVPVVFSVSICRVINAKVTYLSDINCVIFYHSQLTLHRKFHVCRVTFMTNARLTVTPTNSFPM